MKKNIVKIFLSILLIAAISCVWADGTDIKVANINYPGTVKIGKDKLILNGAGIRTKFFVKVYALGLYVPKKGNSTNELLSMAGPKLVEIHMLRDVDAKDFIEALQEGLDNNNSDDILAKLKVQIGQLETLMNQARQANIGDTITFEFKPASKSTLTAITRGGKTLMKTTIGGGADFYNAILNIWIGKDPVDRGLKIDIINAK